MTNFMDAYNEKQEDQSTAGTFLPPFVGHPSRLSQGARQELAYRYQYLDESIPHLARYFRLTPKALEEWLDEVGLTQTQITTDEEYSELEEKINQDYSRIRIKLSGLIARRSLRAYDVLEQVEDYLLASLKSVAEGIAAREEMADIQELKRITDIHAKLVDRQQVIKDALLRPSDNDASETVGGIIKSLEDLCEEIDRDGYKLPSETR